MAIDEYAVLAPTLQLRGLDGVWPFDAPFMPNPITGNPNATHMMIGMKLGDLLSGGAP